MSIGEFARRSRLSPKALRLYDELGLLEPARVDDDSGYRYYSASQLDRAQLIAALRQLQIPLAEIKSIVDLEPDAAAGGSPSTGTPSRPNTRLAETSPATSSTVCKERGMPCMKSPHGTSLPAAFCRSSATWKELMAYGRSAKSSSRSCATTPTEDGWAGGSLLLHLVGRGQRRQRRPPGIVPAGAHRSGGAARIRVPELVLRMNRHTVRRSSSSADRPHRTGAVPAHHPVAARLEPRAQGATDRPGRKDDVPRRRDRTGARPKVPTATSRSQSTDQPSARFEARLTLKAGPSPSRPTSLVSRQRCASPYP